MGSPYIYLLLRSPLSQNTIDILNKTSKVADKVNVGDFIVIVIHITYDELNNILMPYLAGKYSTIDKEYVNTYFPPTREDGAVNITRLVFDRSDMLRKYWEDKIGVKLPSDAEVWSIVDPQTEDISFLIDYYRDENKEGRAD